VLYYRGARGGAGGVGVVTVLPPVPERVGRGLTGQQRPTVRGVQVAVRGRARRVGQLARLALRPEVVPVGGRVGPEEALGDQPVGSWCVADPP
jgi:hypothetical protein